VPASVDCINDPALPTLSEVLNPLDLRQFLPSQTKALQHLQVRLLRHHAGKRCVVEITLRTREGPSRPEALANLQFFGAAVCLQLAESDVCRREASLEEGPYLGTRRFDHNENAVEICSVRVHRPVLLAAQDETVAEPRDDPEDRGGGRVESWLN